MTKLLELFPCWPSSVTGNVHPSEAIVEDGGEDGCGGREREQSGNMQRGSASVDGGSVSAAAGVGNEWYEAERERLKQLLRITSLDQQCPSMRQGRKGGGREVSSVSYLGSKGRVANGSTGLRRTTR
eukprot:GHVU01138646.1.p2 GENE.GHVU01138646.1~~GHVU01138646.1.p2  ORF type:complete len:127 (+),score=10.16 GHVU01138646.1:610-990(+)